MKGEREAVTKRSFSVACLVNDDEVLEQNLLASPMISAPEADVTLIRGAASASKGYNDFLETCRGDIAILVHQDVYLPPGWDHLLQKRIVEVESVDPNWGVIAASGIGRSGTAWGPVWSSSIGQIVGQVALEPVPIQSADELLLVVRCDPKLRFDEALPHFHFYGTDIIQIALKAGFSAWSVALPCVHNDGFKPDLDQNYTDGFNHIRKKWRERLPLRSTTITIAWHGLHLYKSRKAMRESLDHREQIAARAQQDPLQIAECCGWASL